MWLQQRLLYHKNANFDNQQLYQAVYNEFLDSDLNKSMKPHLPSLIEDKHKVIIGEHQPIILQIADIFEVGVSSQTLLDVINSHLSGSLKQGHKYNDISDKQYESIQFPRGMLKFQLTDGYQSVDAIEYKPLSNLNLLTPIGIKISVSKALILRGVLLLGPENITVLGGYTEEHRSINAIKIRLLKQLGIPITESSSEINQNQETQETKSDNGKEIFDDDELFNENVVWSNDPLIIADVTPDVDRDVNNSSNSNTEQSQQIDDNYDKVTTEIIHDDNYDKVTTEIIHDNCLDKEPTIDRHSFSEPWLQNSLVNFDIDDMLFTNYEDDYFYAMDEETYFDDLNLVNMSNDTCPQFNEAEKVEQNLPVFELESRSVTLNNKGHNTKAADNNSLTSSPPNLSSCDISPTVPKFIDGLIPIASQDMFSSQEGISDELDDISNDADKTVLIISDDEEGFTYKESEYFRREKNITFINAITRYRRATF
ncbi:309_t:CDS:2 [Scutellospora calospora]|uniref:309_t:CDS:1 n=1 Tax=Scutellospora calospora TaxID=85575 RepID=A0ACA9MH29_9GLOM|nr:309_t:CDS:2 [Scutellospora calospora]